MATILIFVLLLCTFTLWTDGSQISFQAYPSTLKANVTDAASMRCELEDTELTRSFVTNTTQDVQHVTSILITKNDGQDVAHASAFDTPVALTDIGNLEVKGDVTGTSSKGYLELTWKTPALMAIGQYTCEIGTIDTNRHRTVFRSSLELSRVEPTMNDLVVLFQQQHLQIAGLQQEVATLKHENLNQSLEIAHLKKCTNPRVAFMAVMTSSKSMTTNTQLIYDKLVTDDTDGSFDLATSKFTCKHPGTYSFALNVVVNSPNYSCLNLFVNSVKITSATAWEDKQWYDSGSGHAVVKLKENDVVYVKTGGCSKEHYYHDSNIYYANSFSGHLIQDDACLP